MNPSMPHMHPHLPAQQGEAARIIYDNTPAPINPNELVDQMGRLNVRADRFVPGGDRFGREFAPSKPIYVGYTFFKADGVPGHKPNWKQIEKNKMNLSQDALGKLVKNGAKTQSVTRQYKSLTKLKRSHVDTLIADLEQSNPQFDWNCVFVKEEQFDAEGGYETTSMDVIIMGKPINRSNAKARVLDDTASIHLHDRMPSQSDPRLPENDPRTFIRNGPPDEQWGGPGFQQGPQQIPQQMHPQHPQHPQNIQQPTPQFPQNGPHPPPPPPHHPSQPMGGQQFPNQEPWTPGGPVNGHRSRQEQFMHGQMGPGPGPGQNPGVGFQEHGMRGTPGGPNARQWAEIHQHPHQANMNPRRAKSPYRSPDSEPELVHEISGSSEDESFDYDEGDTEAAHHSDDSGECEKARYRGSLYRHDSSSNSKRQNHGFRTHARKSSQKIHRPRGSAEFIEMIPGDSRRSKRRLGKTYRHSREVARRGWEQPRIIQTHGSIDDSDILYLEPPRGGRLQHDARERVRSLYERENDLEEQQKWIDYQHRMLNDRIINERIVGDRMNDVYPGRRLLRGRRGY